jgi:hypothetical protein
MAAYDAVPLAPLDVSAGPVTTSEQLTMVIISLARGSLGRDEADILLGASPPSLRTPSPSALALLGLSALPSATTIDAEQIHHGGGVMQQIEQVAVVWLQAVALPRLVVPRCPKSSCHCHASSSRRAVR